MPASLVTCPPKDAGLPSSSENLWNDIRSTGPIPDYLSISDLQNPACSVVYFTGSLGREHLKGQHSVYHKWLHFSRKVVLHRWLKFLSTPLCNSVLLFQSGKSHNTECSWSGRLDRISRWPDFSLCRALLGGIVSVQPATPGQPHTQTMLENIRLPVSLIMRLHRPPSMYDSTGPWHMWRRAFSDSGQHVRNFTVVLLSHVPRRVPGTWQVINTYF